MSLQRSSRILLRKSITSPFSSFVNDHHLNKGHHDIHSISRPNFDECRPYKNRKVSHLLRSLAVFKLCEFETLVQNGVKFLAWSRRVLGDKLTDAIIRETFFLQFCGGEHHDEVVEKLHELRREHIGSILDYAAESEEEQSPSALSLLSSSSSSVKNQNQPAKVYNYHSEELCDDNLQRFLQCIKTVRDSDLTNEAGNQFAAIKVSALGDPVLLSKMSDFARKAQAMIASYDATAKGYVTREEFEQMHRSLYSNNETHNRNFMQYIDLLDPKGKNSIDHIDWCTAAFTTAPECLEGTGLFASREIDLVQAMHHRATKIADDAFASDVRLLIDAEQSWIQPAIDVISQSLQQSHNHVDKIDHPIVFNTYQCYLKKALGQIRMDTARARRLGYHFGTKLVRGAYMQRERERAVEMKYASPIQDTAQDTHDSYNAAVQTLLQEILDLRANLSPVSFEMMCATHNRESIEWAISLMEELGLGPTTSDHDGNKNMMNGRGMISFSQLYGMSDDLTIPLAEHGYNVYKYVPFGPIREVIPYMLRRAQENGDVLGKSQNEIQLIRDELTKRMLWK